MSDRVVVHRSSSIESKSIADATPISRQRHKLPKEPVFTYDLMVA